MIEKHKAPDPMRRSIIIMIRGKSEKMLHHTSSSLY